MMFPGSNLNSVMHKPAGSEIERWRPALTRRQLPLTTVPGVIPHAVDSLEPKLRERFHGLEVNAGVFKTAATQGCGHEDKGGRGG
jgi:hypothetical protein